MRCPNGTRKNKQGDCIPKENIKSKLEGPKKRCPNGTRKNKQGDCIPSKTGPKNVKPKLDESMKRIQSFMKRTTQKRRGVYLKTICSESGLCIAFGIESLKIKKFFNNFDFKLVDQVKRIGSPSSNGFVNELRYTKNDYTSYAVLKSSTNDYSDNLMYEYRVGQFLNKMSLLFPCFLETYGLFKYNSSLNWKHMKETKQVLPSVFSASLKHQPYNLKVGCNESKYMSILIQHIRGCQTVGEMLTKDTFHHILPILFQVYYPLFHMRKHFTHYDLHQENVILYEPVPGKYIQFHYQTETGFVTFKSPYIVKIIDYGRSYFKDIEDSKDIYDEICSLKECDPLCGIDKGFATFQLSNETNFHHIVSQQKNESHDLRFLKIVLDMLDKFQTPRWFEYYKNSFNVRYESNYGTPENICKKKIFYFFTSRELCNIEDVYKHLEKILPLSNVQLDGYHNEKYGDLYVYSNKHIEFRKA